MPFFNLRRAGGPNAGGAGPAPASESVEVVRKRAKHRLIGSAVLVLAGVVGFPLLFDTQPRPVAIDIPIEIPGKNTVKPLTAPAAPNAPRAADATAAKAPAPAATEPEKVAAASSLTPQETILADKRPVVTESIALPAIKKEAKVEPKVELKPEPKAEFKPKAEAKVEVKPATQPEAKTSADESARAKALLNGEKSPAAANATTTENGRIVVQVGAFADVAKAREARLKLEKAGLKTYTQVAETAAGQRIRVRVGPFATRAEADKAASKIKTLDLPAAILTL